VVRSKTALGVHVRTPDAGATYGLERLRSQAFRRATPIATGRAAVETAFSSKP